MNGSFLGSIDARRLLDALEGVNYVTDQNGVIREIGTPAWDTFAVENDAPEMTAEGILGRNLFEMIGGEEVRDAYRAMHEAVVTQARPRACFTFRCDSPDTERWMRMSISLIHGERDRGVLYQSQLLRAETRPSVALFAREHIIAELRRDAASRRPVALCSYCQRVADGVGEGRRWIEPTTYYAEGGSSDVRVSHGICSDCLYSVVEPNLRATA